MSDRHSDSTTPPAKKPRLADSHTQDNPSEASTSASPITANHVRTSKDNFNPETPSSTLPSTDPTDRTEADVANATDTALNTLPSELVTVCEVCGCKVPVWEGEEHNDYHLALELQRLDQREGVRGHTGPDQREGVGGHTGPAKKSKNPTILDFVTK